MRPTIGPGGKISKPKVRQGQNGFWVKERKEKKGARRKREGQEPDRAVSASLGIGQGTRKIATCVQTAEGRGKKTEKRDQVLRPGAHGTLMVAELGHYKKTERGKRSCEVTVFRSTLTSREKKRARHTV